MVYDLLFRDIIEIIFYSVCIFTFCQWLKTDKTKNLIIYFFAYAFFIRAAWITQLPTLSFFLCNYAPIALLLFIILHEKTLQRNLVHLRTITPARINHENWLDILISSSLTLINAHKSITVIIEHKDALDYYLTAPFFINADIEKNVLDIFLLNPFYDEQKMIWVNTTGILKSINVIGKFDKEKVDNALFYTIENDAIIFKTNPTSRNFSLFLQGKEVKNLSSHTIYTMIQRELTFNRKKSINKNSLKEKELSN